MLSDFTVMEEGDGLFTSWHENGQKEGEVTYKDGGKDGKWTYYNEDGSIIEELIYKDGELIKIIEY